MKLKELGDAGRGVIVQLDSLNSLGFRSPSDFEIKEKLLALGQSGERAFRESEIVA